MATCGFDCNHLPHPQHVAANRSDVAMTGLVDLISSADCVMMIYRSVRHLVMTACRFDHVEAGSTAARRKGGELFSRSLLDLKCSVCTDDAPISFDSYDDERVDVILRRGASGLTILTCPQG